MIGGLIRLLHIRWDVDNVLTLLVEMEQVQYSADIYKSDILSYIKKDLLFPLFTTHRLNSVPSFSVLAWGERGRETDIGGGLQF